MNNDLTEQLDLQELCQATSISAEIVIEIVEHGIIEPVGHSPEEWFFSPQMITTTRKAVRLHRDLEINWTGIALAVSLLDELEQLRDKNKALEFEGSYFSKTAYIANEGLELYNSGEKEPGIEKITVQCPGCRIIKSI